MCRYLNKFLTQELDRQHQIGSGVFHSVCCMNHLNMVHCYLSYNFIAAVATDLRRNDRYWYYSIFLRSVVMDGTVNELFKVVVHLHSHPKK